MASAGGYIEKLGNRYEGLWVVRQMLEVLRGELLSVGIEAIGDDEQGVDSWIEFLDKHREAQQCKRQNGISAQWSFADLDRENVLKTICKQLSENASNLFSFVSPIPARMLDELSREARDSGGQAEGFRQVLSKKDTRYKSAFRDFCNRTGLNQEDRGDFEKAWDLLRRTFYHPFADDFHSRRDLRLLVSLILSGAPDGVISLLAGFAQDNLRRPLYADELFAYLRSQGVHPKDLARDSRLPAQVEMLKQRFARSIALYLAGDSLIPRAETQSLLEEFKNPDSNRLIILHGKAGAGKSGVFLEIVQQLDQDAIPYLSLRLDRWPLVGGAAEFGRAQGLPDSPALCLEALAGSRRGVLILDQLDALRWTSAHSHEAWQVIQEVVSQALAFKNLTVIVGCRTFDLEHDPQFKKWRPAETAKQIEVKDLEERDVREFMSRIGERYNDLSAREKQLLGSVHNLTLWYQIRKSKGHVPRFRSQTELMKEFWRTRRQQWVQGGHQEESLNALLEHVVRDMEKYARLWSPGRLIEDKVRDGSALQSLSILQVADDRISFCHQSYLDFQVAQRVFARLIDQQETILNWLGDRTKQSLFRREQLRQVLSMARDEDETCYLALINTLLGTQDVRFHLKHLVLEMLGQVEQPSSAEAALVASLLEQEDWREHVLDQVIFKQVGWIRALQQNGILGRWLGGDQTVRINNVIWLLRSVNEECGDLVYELISPYQELGGEWKQRCLSVLPFHPDFDTDALFEMRMRLSGDAPPSDFIDWKRMAESHPGRALRLLDAALKRTLKVPRTERPAKQSRLEMGDSNTTNALKVLACKFPREALANPR